MSKEIKVVDVLDSVEFPGLPVWAVLKGGQSVKIKPFDAVSSEKKWRKNALALIEAHGLEAVRCWEFADGRLSATVLPPKGGSKGKSLFAKKD